MAGEVVRGWLVVLQSVQPLTTDLRPAAGWGAVVLTDGPVNRVARSDAPAPGRVISGPRSEWPGRLQELRGAAAVEVVTNDEYALRECAHLRERLGLSRVTSLGLDGYLDKVLMKTRLAAESVPVPRWVSLDDMGPVSDGLGLPQALSLPVVAKPRIGANSRGVQIISAPDQWQEWVRDKAGQSGWEIEEYISGPMCFVDALVVNGEYTPVLVGRYLGGLLPSPEVQIVGAVSVPRQDAFWERAVDLGRRVAHALGIDGRFATHLEFFEHRGTLIVMEACARAPGAMVSEMARVVSGHNLETAHLSVQAGQPAPRFAPTGEQAAWISPLARPGQNPTAPPPRLDSGLVLHRLPAPSATSGRHLAAIGLLRNSEYASLVKDVDRCAAHIWYAQELRQAPGPVSLRE